MTNVLTKAGAFIMMIALGYVLKRVGVFRAGDFRVLSNIVLKITLPCAVITNFSKLTIAPALLLLVPLGILCNLVMISLGWLAGRKKGPGEQAFNMINFSGYNIGCFTMPYVQGFLGPAAVVAACLYDAGNSLLCTGGTYSLASMVAEQGRKTTLKEFLKKIFSSVPLDTYVVMMIVSTAHLTLPQGILVFTDTVGAANGFLSMLMIGVGFECRFPKGQLARIIRSLLIRYGASTVFALLFYFFLPLPLEVRQVLTLVVFAPISAIATAFTEKCGGDLALSSAMNSFSILASITIMTGLLLSMNLA